MARTAAAAHPPRPTEAPPRNGVASASGWRARAQHFERVEEEAREEPSPQVLSLRVVEEHRALVRDRDPDDCQPWTLLRLLEVNLTRRAIVDAVRPPDNHPLDAAECTQDILEAWMEEVAPRTPLERLLALQALWAHVRAGRLCGLSARSEGRAFEALDPAADRALRTASRLVKAYADLQARSLANELGSGRDEPRDEAAPLSPQ